MRCFAFVTLAFLTACGGSSDKTSSTSNGGSGPQAGAGGSGGATGGSGGAGGSSGGGGSAGVDAGPYTCADGGTIDAGGEAAILAACVVAVVKVTRIDGECSGAGGAHITLDVVKLGRGTGVTRIHYGGHAYYAPPEGPDKLGEFFVAGIDPFGSLMNQPDNPGWCLTGLPAIDGEAHTLLEASDEADATAKMNAILGL
jgi:hypothetical protein